MKQGFHWLATSVLSIDWLEAYYLLLHVKECFIHAIKDEHAKDIVFCKIQCMLYNKMYTPHNVYCILRNRGFLPCTR